MSPDLQGRVADMINESFVGIDVSKAWLDVGFLLPAVLNGWRMTRWG